MIVPLSQRLLTVLCGLVVGFITATASAQEPLTKAKALYDAAAYEEALILLASVNIPEAQQYRALCMLALGRAQDASGVVELLVSASPTFEPSTEDVPPRFVTLVSEAKKKLLPGIARKVFNEGREQFKTGEREAALKNFDLVVTLTSSPGFKESSDAEDLRTLATGFIELANATAPQPARADAKAPAPVPTNVAAAAPETPAPAEAANTQAAAEVIQPVVVRQTIPPVPSGISGLGSPTASVKVEIGVDGKVVNASMQQPSHPLYDRLVLQAARDWLYSPALLNGRPVPSEKVVTIQLR
jgi:tetratricopeptide (TPR) repeat protein